MLQDTFQKMTDGAKKAVDNATAFASETGAQMKTNVDELTANAKDATAQLRAGAEELATTATAQMKTNAAEFAANAKDATDTMTSAAEDMIGKTFNQHSNVKVLEDGTIQVTLDNAVASMFAEQYAKKLEIIIGDSTYRWVADGSESEV